MTAQTIDFPPLTTFDRCVGRTATGKNRAATNCGAQAMYRFVKAENDLTFCGHCSTELWETLEFQGFHVIIQEG